MWLEDCPTALVQRAGPDFVDNDFLGEQAVRSLFDPEDFTIDFNTSVPFSGGNVQVSVRSSR